MYDLNDALSAPMNDSDAIDVYFRHDTGDDKDITPRSPEAEAYGWMKDGDELSYDLGETHTLMGSFSSILEVGVEAWLGDDQKILSAAFVLLQGENWSPNGEANELIRSTPRVHHTSLSVGDVIDIRGRRYVCSFSGWKVLSR